MDLREEVVRVKEIEDAIVHISGALKKIRAGKLTDRGLVALLKDMLPKTVSKENIYEVINGLDRLADFYLKKHPLNEVEEVTTKRKVRR